MMEDLLKTLLESKTKLDLAAFLFSNPERAFYLGEIKKRLGARNLEADLAYFQKLNLFTSFTKKGKRYIRLNVKHPLYSQLRAQINKGKKAYEDELTKNVAKLPGIKVVILTGLFVGNPDAECDMLLVGKIPEQKVAEFSKGAEKVMGQEINYALFETEEFKYRQNMFDRFMKDVFENEHMIIVNKIK
jgi:hypothetical protein